MEQNITTNRIGQFVAVFALVAGLGFAIPSSASAVWTGYDLGGSYGSGYSDAGTIWGTKPCCGGSYSSYAYPTYKPSYNYGYDNYGYGDYGYDDYGGYGSSDLNLSFTYQDNDVDLSNETTYNNNVNINQVGNDNYVGGVGISNENNTDQDGTINNSNDNDAYRDFGDYVYRGSYIGGPGSYSSTDFDDETGQNNNSNININNHVGGPGNDDEDDEEPTCDISANDTSIEEGDSTTLSWNSDNADSASINQGIGNVATDGFRSVSPDNDTTYTLSVRGDGGTDTCSVTINVSEDDDDDNDDDDNDEPWCDIEASDTSVEEGDRITLEWDTRNADEASINQGIGRVDEDGGSLRVRMGDDDITFRMTVEDNDGDEETCSVSVNVDEDDNDDDDNDNAFSSTIFTDEPPQNPPQTVYLSSIPYTGLGDISPEVMAYWLLLIAGAGGVAWFMFSKGMIRQLAPAYSGEVMYAQAEEEIETDASAFISALESDEKEAALEELRTAAANGTGIEEFLAVARASVADEDTIASRIDAMIEGSRMTGIRGAKLALGA